MRSAEGFISAPGIIALCRDWRLAPRQGNLHFPCDSLRCLPFCVPHESEHLALQAIHFHGVLLTVSGGDTIAIYHCSIKIVSRGKGKSAVAAAAYRAGEKLTNEWDGLTHDYTRKGGVVHSEIMLPPHAPPSFSDRSILWNSVEQIEKSNNSQLAREIEIALPVELSREEQTRLVREYCSSQFVSKGMCHREGLYQIDLLNGSKNRVTDREYWAQKKGQAALDKQNAPMIAGGITPRQTKFETNKEKLRQTIRKALATAASFDEFSSLLLREGVTVKESRGRLSYLTPDRTKPITARKLGDDFDRTAVLAVLEQNAARAIEKAAAIPEYPWQEKRGIQPAKAPQTAPKQDGVQRLVDIEQKMAEGKGRGYERWAKIHNLKQAAKTLSVYQQYGFTSPEQLEAAVDTAYAEMRQTSGELKALETKLQGKKELQRQVLAYAKTKPARDGLKAQKSEKARAAYRQAHESDFIIADAAARYFKAHGITKLPARKALQAEIEQLISEKDGLYNTYHEQKQRFKELQTVKRNIDQILRRDEPHRRKEQSHER